MQWATEEEKDFKLKYFEAKKSLTVDNALYQVIKVRLADLEKQKEKLDENTYSNLKAYFNNRLKWADEVDKELEDIAKENNQEEATLEEITKNYSAKKVKSKLKDIRDN